MQQAMQMILSKMDEQELPYRNTRIGFGSTLNSDTKA